MKYEMRFIDVKVPEMGQSPLQRSKLVAFWANEKLRIATGQYADVLCAVIRRERNFRRYTRRYKKGTQRAKA